MKPERHFASDNGAGAHPEVLAAIADANAGHVAAYGADPITDRAIDRIRDLLGPDTAVFFAFNGTGANVVAFAAALRPHQAVIAPAGAHLNVDECGALERVGGNKIVAVPVVDGKLSAADVARQMHGIGDQHHVQPGAISISQSTENGTVYSLAELRALGSVAREYGLFFHVDGARIANAVASLDTDLRAMLLETGVDAFTFGGTKNGMLFGEAIVFPKPHPAVEFVPYVRKAGLQLPSKMRFVAAQFDAMLADGLWLRSARHANAMARRLSAGLTAIGVTLAYPTQANGVFPILPRAAIAPLQRVKRFYVWNEAESIVRLMCSFDTTEDDVDSFIAAVEREVAAHR
jgi:threonine aldolase